jgi:hypothetical protein
MANSGDLKGALDELKEQQRGQTVNHHGANCAYNYHSTRPNFGPQEETFKFITALNKVSKGDYMDSRSDF